MQSRRFKVAKKGKGKKQNTYEERLPKKVGVSPMLSNGEQIAVRDVTASFYGEIVSSKPEEWLHAVSSNGFVEMYKRIKNLYGQRWTLQERFATLTTNRLKILRIELKNPGLRKADIEQSSIIQALSNESTELTKQFLADCENLVKDLKRIEDLRQGIQVWHSDQTIKEFISSTVYAKDREAILGIRDKKERDKQKAEPTPSEASGVETKKSKPPDKKVEKVKQVPVNIPTLKEPLELKSKSLTEVLNSLFILLATANKWVAFKRIEMSAVSLQLFRVFKAFSNPNIRFTKSVEEDARLVLGTKLHPITAGRLLDLKRLNPVVSQFQRVCEFFATALNDYQDTSS